MAVDLAIARLVVVSVLVARELYRFFHTEADEVMALRGVSLSVDTGEFLAVVGPSGSGKSTLLACLAGLDDPDGGCVELDGARVSHRPEAVRAALRARLIGVVLQERNLVEHLDAWSNVVLALKLAGVRGTWRVQRTLELVGLADRSGSVPSKLSGGEAVRAGLAVAVAKQPKLLLADEPTAELDEMHELAVAEMLCRLAGDGIATVVATHSERLAAAADRVVLLEDGRVVDG